MDRRSAIRRMAGALMGAPAAARAVQEEVASSAIRSSVGANALMNPGYGVPKSSGRAMPWALQQLQKWIGKEREERRERVTAYEDALIGRVPPDISALRSIQPHARARMHLRRFRQSEFYAAEKRISDWWDSNDD